MLQILEKKRKLSVILPTLVPSVEILLVFKEMVGIVLCFTSMKFISSEIQVRSASQIETFLAFATTHIVRELHKNA